MSKIKEFMKKSSGGMKVLVAFLIVINLFLAIALVIVFGMDFISGGGSPTLSDDFKTNSDTYFDNYGEEITPNEDSIKIITNAGKKFSETETPTPTEQVEETEGNDLDDEEFLFPESDTRLITEEEMKETITDGDTCRRAINEIYARHGYQFTNSKILEHFNQYEWYQNIKKESDMDKVSAGFSEIEKKNIEKIQQYKTANGL